MILSILYKLPYFKNTNLYKIIAIVIIIYALIHYILFNDYIRSFIHILSYKVLPYKIYYKLNKFKYYKYLFYIIVLIDIALFGYLYYKDIHSSIIGLNNEIDYYTNENIKLQQLINFKETEIMNNENIISIDQNSNNINHNDNNINNEDNNIITINNMNNDNTNQETNNINETNNEQSDNNNNNIENSKTEQNPEQKQNIIISSINEDIKKDEINSNYSEIKINKVKKHKHNKNTKKQINYDTESISINNTDAESESISEISGESIN